MLFNNLLRFKIVVSWYNYCADALKTTTMKPKFNPILILFLIAVLALFSCSPAYVPTSVEVPIFKEKGEVKASVQTGTCGIIDPHFSVAITDNVALMFNGSYGNSSSDSSDSYHYHLTGEFGLGYYENFGNAGFYQVFAGYGLSQVKSRSDFWLIDDNTNEPTNAYMHKLFFQPSIGFTYPYIDFAFTPRMTFIHMDVYNRTYDDLFFEPVLTLTLGSPNFKLTGQGGLSIPMQVIDYDYRVFIINIGCSFIFGRNTN